MSVNMPTLEQVLDDAKDNPSNLKSMIEKNPELLNFLIHSSSSKNDIKYVRFTDDDKRRLEEMRNKGIAEGVVIGLAVALFFALVFRKK